MKCLLFWAGLFLATGALWAAAPTNDDFAHPTDLPARYVYGSSSPLDYYSSTHLSQVLTNATAEPGEPDSDGIPTEHSAWFKWTSPVDAGCNFDFGTGTKGRPHAAVFTGDTLDALRLESSSGLDTNYNVAVASFRAHQGVTYRLRVDVTGLTNRFPGGANVLGGCALFIATNNDDFAGRQLVTLTNGSATNHFRTAGATREAGEPAVNQSASVWFELVTPEAGAYEIRGDGYQLTLGLFRGESVDGLSTVGVSAADNQPVLRFVAQAGERVALAVSDPNGFNFAYYTWDIHRVPRYDPAPAPEVKIGFITVGWPNLVPTNRLGLHFQARPGRLYHVETSPDLQHWRFWNGVISKKPDVVVDLGNEPPIDNFVRVVAPD